MWPLGVTLFAKQRDSYVIDRSRYSIKVKVTLFAKQCDPLGVTLFAKQHDPYVTNSSRNSIKVGVTLFAKQRDP